MAVKRWDNILKQDMCRSREIVLTLTFTITNKQKPDPAKPYPWRKGVRRWKLEALELGETQGEYKNKHKPRQSMVEDVGKPIWQ